MKIEENITVKGKTYVVDGKKILQDHDKTEEKIADMIAKRTGKNVHLLPRIIEPKNVKCADYLIEGEKWDLKTPESKSKNIIYNSVHKKRNKQIILLLI